MGLEARDFSEKKFFGNFKILCDLSCASRPTPQGGPHPRITAFCHVCGSVTAWNGAKGINVHG